MDVPAVISSADFGQYHNVRYLAPVRFDLARHFKARMAEHPDQFNTWAYEGMLDMSYLLRHALKDLAALDIDAATIEHYVRIHGTTPSNYAIRFDIPRAERWLATHWWRTAAVRYDRPPDWLCTERFTLIRSTDAFNRQASNARMHPTPQFWSQHVNDWVDYTRADRYSTVTDASGVSPDCVLVPADPTALLDNAPDFPVVAVPADRSGERPGSAVLLEFADVLPTIPPSAMPHVAELLRNGETRSGLEILRNADTAGIEGLTGPAVRHVRLRTNCIFGQFAGPRLSAATEAVGRVVGVGHDQAEMIVSEFQFELVPPGRRHLVYLILHECWTGTVTFRTVAPLLEAAEVDYVADCGEFMAIEDKDSEFRVFHFSELQISMYNSWAKVPTGLDSSGFGDPAYVSDTLLTLI